jgi:hypothetical protein
MKKIIILLGIITLLFFTNSILALNTNEVKLVNKDYEKICVIGWVDDVRSFRLAGSWQGYASSNLFYLFRFGKVEEGIHIYFYTLIGPTECNGKFGESFIIGRLF